MEIQIKNLITDTISGEWGKEPTGTDDVKVIRTANFTNEGEINFTHVVDRHIEASKVQTKKLIKGDIIIEKSGGSPTQPVGRVVFFDIDSEDDFLCNNFTTILRPDKQKVYPSFLFYQLHIAHKRGRTLRYQNKTTGIINLKLEKYLEESIEVPSLSDQIKIATILNKAETLIKQRKESIDMLDEFLKSTFLKMFGDLKGAKTTLGECCEVNPVKSEIKDVPKNTEVSFMPMAAVSETGDIDLSQTRTLSDVWAGFTYFKDGDVVFAKITPSMENGKGAIMRSLKNGIGFGTTEFHVLRPIGGKSTSEWIYHLTKQTSFRELAERNMTGTAGQKRVPSSFLKSYMVTIPSIALQNQFAAITEKTDVLKAQFRNSLTDLENLYASLSHRAFKGELDLSAVEIDETLLIEDKKEEPAVSISPDLQKAIEFSNKINKQFESIDKITKVTPGLARQMEQWNKLQDQFKNIPKLPAALLQAQKNMAKVAEAIAKSRTVKIPVEEESSFNWAVLANLIKERYKDLHFNFEMLHNFIQKDKLADVTPYYASEELKANPRLNDAEDLKSFIQSAIQNIEMDEKQQRQTNPFLRLTQSFYNAEEENLTLSLHKEDFNLIKDKTARLRSGIYFSIATDA